MKQISLSLAAALPLLGMVPAFACEGENMIYEDSFDEDDGQWSPRATQAADDAPMKLQDGKLILSPQAGQYNYMSPVNQAQYYDDADVCVTMSFIKEADPGWTRGGLVFWYKGQNDFYVLQVDVQGRFAIQRLLFGKWFNVVDLTENANLKKGEGAVNHLRVVTVGKQAKVFINGEEVASFEGHPPEGGSFVGLAALSPLEGEPSVYAFDDFKGAEPAESVAMRKSASSDQDASLKAERKKAARAVPPPRPAMNRRAADQPKSVPAMKK